MVWVIAIALLAFFAGLGFWRGSIQMVSSLLGLLFSLAIVIPLTASSIKSEFAGKPELFVPGIFALIVYPLLVFIYFSVCFMYAGVFVSAKTKEYLRARMDEAKVMMFQRLNRRLGAAVGLLIGMIYIVGFGVLVYGPGYLTHQTSASDDPAWLSFITDARQSMEETGLEKVAAILDPLPPRFYEISDILGLAHKNPLLENRFRNYPPFMKLPALYLPKNLEDQWSSEWAGVEIMLTLASEATGSDETEAMNFKELLAGQPSLASVLKEPYFWMVVNTPRMIDLLLEKTDLADLETYFKTGKSPLFDDELILGRWQLDFNATINHLKRTKIGVDILGEIADEDGRYFPGTVTIKSEEFRQFGTNPLIRLLDKSRAIFYPDNTWVGTMPHIPMLDDAPEPDDEPDEFAPFNPQDEFSQGPGGFGPQDPYFPGLGPGQNPQQKSPEQLAQEFLRKAANQYRENNKIAAGGTWQRQVLKRYRVISRQIPSPAIVEDNRLIIREFLPFEFNLTQSSSNKAKTKINVDLIFSRVY